jgi:hypothetical protein
MSLVYHGSILLYSALGVLAIWDILNNTALLEQCTAYGVSPPISLSRGGFSRDPLPGQFTRVVRVGAGVGWMWSGDACVALGAPRSPRLATSLPDTFQKRRENAQPLGVRWKSKQFHKHEGGVERAISKR